MLAYELHVSRLCGRKTVFEGMVFQNDIQNVCKLCCNKKGGAK